LFGCVVVVIVAVVALAQDEKERPTIQQVEAKYGPQIKRLDGVLAVELATRGAQELLIVGVVTEDDRKLLDNLLSDELEGYQILFEVRGKPQETDPGAQAGEKEASEEKQPGTPLCFKCAGPKYPPERGMCAECGGWTQSTAFKYCDECARKLHVCARCGAPFKQEK
jgi:hypothetical protein